MNDQRPYNVLFLCTHNSARSVLAEAILNRLGAGRFVAHSAGSMPSGRINPHALALLDRLGHPTDHLRSKAWDEFSRELNPQAPELDFVFTVCDNAAGEVCPIWPGQPMTAHWGVADPSEAQGGDPQIALAFAEAYRQLTARITPFCALPISSLDRLTLKARLDRIGQDQVGAPGEGPDAPGP